jgi:hypothetical protein
VNNGADKMGAAELKSAVDAMVADGTFDGPGWEAEYLSRSYEVDESDLPLRFLSGPLRRAAVKYGRAVAHSAVMARHIRDAAAGRPYEIEVSVDETDSPTSPLEHLFFALELKRRGVQNVVSLAPRFVGEMEKGIDYRGDLATFERCLRHCASLPHSATVSCPARACGETSARANPSSSTKPASAPRSILRRWPNPARTSANSAAGSASVSGVARRVMRTRADSTRGFGRNTFGPTSPTISASAQYATFTDGMPYALVPGEAASRSPTSRCTITSKLVIAGTASSTSSTNGVATL